MSVTYHVHNGVATIEINRVDRRNAVDLPTARALYDAALKFENDKSANVAILKGAGEHFCAGADLKAVAGGEPLGKRVLKTGDFGPMGPTRLVVSKPVIAAIEGYCLAGGLELALWCDLRVGSESSVLGFKCRERGVPLVDGGTVRLPRLIGHSRAADIILTGRDVNAKEAYNIGLLNRVCKKGLAYKTAFNLARTISNLPQNCLRNDWESAKAQWHMKEKAALLRETRLGLKTIRSGETLNGAKKFTGTRKP
jgi:enoyl-CoA hydratase